ncbi:conserved hypothetical protein [Ricinus communis]|uniref:Uncharacterized protein n=1 Tax=Ricinus communis TaxID=3988 RepID=B9RA63_RICCO|nr:conserved hypothetical protein [Ricinus communis]
MARMASHLLEMDASIPVMLFRGIRTRLSFSALHSHAIGNIIFGQRESFPVPRNSFIKKDPYVAGMQLGHNPSILKPQHALQEVEGLQYVYFRSLICNRGSLDPQLLTAPRPPNLEYQYDSWMQYAHAPTLKTRRSNRVSYHRNMFLMERW